MPITENVNNFDVAMVEIIIIESQFQKNLGKWRNMPLCHFLTLSLTILIVLTFSSVCWNYTTSNKSITTSDHRTVTVELLLIKCIVELLLITVIVKLHLIAGIMLNHTFDHGNCWIASISNFWTTSDRMSCWITSDHVSVELLLITSLLNYFLSHNCLTTSDYMCCSTTSDHLIVQLTLITEVFFFNYPWSLITIIV